MGAFAKFFPISALLGYILILIFNYGAIAGKWFGDKDVGQVSDIYNVTLTPAGWTFGIWGIIYTWQPLWIIYVIYLSFKAINSGKLYFTKTFWVFYFVSCVFNCIWIAVWVAEEVTLAMIFLILIWLSLVISAYSAHSWLVYEIPFALTQNGTEHALDNYPQSLILSFQQNKNNNNNNENGGGCCGISEKVWLYMGVLNGIPIYATWTTIAACINTSIFFKYEVGLDNSGAVTIGLVLLITNILIYWFCDFIKFSGFLRFTFTPYFVLIWAFLGVLSKYSMSDADSSIVIFILLILAGIASIGKIINSIRLIRKYANDSGNNHIHNGATKAGPGTSLMNDNQTGYDNMV